MPAMESALGEVQTQQDERAKQKDEVRSTKRVVWDRQEELPGRGDI